MASNSSRTPSSCRTGKAPLVPTPTQESGLAYLRPVAGPRTPPGGADLPPYRCSGTNFVVSAFQHIGDRKTQEDRFTLVPTLDPNLPVQNGFFGVFDGTVGDFASDNVKDLVTPKLVESAGWRTFCSSYGSETEDAGAQHLADAFREMYRTADDALLYKCAKYTQHYATCTSVTVCIVGDLLVIGHLGDSRIVLCKEDESAPVGTKAQIIGEQMTEDHKPDQEPERRRIEQCGGMVERLQNHSNKPFIRGGDFMMRKCLGEQPMQLQYSRAFGAKDLKIFGLSNVPDVRIIKMGSSPYKYVRFVILATDGLWDVLTAQQAASIAGQASEEGVNPSEALVRFVVAEQARAKVRADNITAVVIQFDQRR